MATQTPQNTWLPQASARKIRLFPEWVDAVEGINASHSSYGKPEPRTPHWNDKAIAYAAQHDLPITAGSDQHAEIMLHGGMVFSRKLSDSQDLCWAILNREAVAYLDGTQEQR